MYTCAHMRHLVIDFGLMEVTDVCITYGSVGCAGASDGAHGGAFGCGSHGPAGVVERRNMAPGSRRDGGARIAARRRDSCDLARWARRRRDPGWARSVNRHRGVEVCGSE